MWLDCHGFSNQIDPMMSSTWLLICANCLTPCLARCWESEVASGMRLGTNCRCMLLAKDEVGAFVCSLRGASCRMAQSQCFWCFNQSATLLYRLPRRWIGGLVVVVESP